MNSFAPNCLGPEPSTADPILGLASARGDFFQRDLNALGLVKLQDFGTASNSLQTYSATIA